MSMSMPMEEAKAQVNCEVESGAVSDRGADLGLQFLEKSGRINFTKEEESRVVRKIDLYMLPIVRMLLGGLECQLPVRNNVLRLIVVKYLAHGYLWASIPR